MLKAHRDKSLPVPIAHYESKLLFKPTRKALQPLMGDIQYYPVPIEHYQDLDLSQFLRHNQSDYLAFEFIFEADESVSDEVTGIPAASPYPISKEPIKKVLTPLAQTESEVTSVVSKSISSEVINVVSIEVSETKTESTDYQPSKVTTDITTPITSNVTTVDKKKKPVVTKKKRVKVTTPRKTVKDVVIEVSAIKQNGVRKLKYTYYKKNEPVTVYYTLTQISRKISSYKTKLKQTTNEAAKKNRADWLLFWTEQREKLKNEQ